MKTQFMSETTTDTTPFLLGLTEEIDKEMYDKAITSAEIIKEAYDPKTQTSNIPAYAGSSLTYMTKTTGPLMASDGTIQSDT